MSDYKDLAHRHAEVSAELAGLTEQVEANGFQDDEQRAKYDALADEKETLGADLARITKQRELESAQVRREHKSGAVTSGQFEGDVTSEPLAVFSTANPAPTVYRGLEGYGLTEEQRIKSAFGQQLIDVMKASRPGSTMSSNLMEIQAAAQGAGENIGADGGFLVQQDAGGMLGRDIIGGSDILRRVRQIPLGPGVNGTSFNAFDETSRATGSRFGGVRGYWVDEGSAPTASKPTYRKVELKLSKVAALGYVTNELMEDATAMGNVMFDAFAEELRWLVENAIINGTGSGQPLGVAVSGAAVEVAKETGQTAATIVSENLSKMWARVHTRSKRNLIWTMNTDCNPELDNLYTTGASSDLEARYITYAPDGVVRIKGREVVETEYNATLGTVNDIIALDPTAYLFASKPIQMASSMHVAFTTDEQAFRVTWRVDGRPAQISAVTPANGTNTLSSYITLATRA